MNVRFPRRRAVRARCAIAPVCAALLATACGASDWRRPRSATDPSDPDAAEASPRQAPALINGAAETPAAETPVEAPAPAHQHHHHGGGMEGS